MCGRYQITSAPEAMRRLFRYPEQPNFPARWNVAPTQPVPIVRLNEGERQFALVRWGLIPAWVKDPRAFTLLINARGESVLDKPAFKNAMKRRRCLVPADGFYEWKDAGGRKRAFCARATQPPIAFAGLWESWMGPNGEELETAAIITTRANRMLGAIHDRMPVVIPQDAFDFWLDCRTIDAETASALLVPAPEDVFDAYDVSNAVNRTVNDGPELVQPLAAIAEATEAAAEPVPEPPRAKPTRKPKTDSRQPSLFD
jgi:putative SOS response-associated peptidase YedK